MRLTAAEGRFEGAQEVDEQELGKPKSESSKKCHRQKLGGQNRETRENEAVQQQRGQQGARGHVRESLWKQGWAEAILSLV